MEHLPPVGWADVATSLDALAVATSRDLDAFEGRMDLKLEAFGSSIESHTEREFRLMTWRLALAIVTVIPLAIAASHLSRGASELDAVGAFGRGCGRAPPVAGPR